MGVDWLRMRPRAGVPRDVLDGAVAAQAAEYTAMGTWHPEEFGHLPAPVAPAASVQLRGLLDIEDESSYRINAVVLNPVFPAEWRAAAFRSHLPDELAERLGVWRTHLAEVEAGGHRAYLRAWYGYRTGLDTAREWAELRHLAAQAGERTNAWAARADLIEVRERILAAPSPIVPAAPSWGEAAEAQRDNDVASYAALAREWNRRVPNGQKVRVTLPPSLAAYLEDALNDTWLAECLDWMQRAADDGCGLFLW